MKVKGHGNGKTNHRTYNVTLDDSFICAVDGHEWIKLRDSDKEICVVCMKERTKEERDREVGEAIEVPPTSLP